MRFSLSLALSALALVSSASANDVSAAADSHLEARDEMPMLMKRTGSHNTYTCSSQQHKLCWNKSSNSCDCKANFARTFNHDWNICDGPKTHGTGDAVCGPHGCDIECHAGMVFDKGAKDCVCQPNYQLHRTGSYCVPQCKVNQELVGGVCVEVCKGDLIRNFITKGCECPTGFELSKARTLHNTKCVPKCKATEELIGGSCLPICKGDLIRNTSTKACECPLGTTLSTKRHNTEKCVPITCPLGQVLSKDKKSCVCASNFELVNKICVPVCTRHEVRNKKGECECKPTCGRRKNVCEPKCPEHSVWSEWKDKCVCAEGFTKWGKECVPECKKNEKWNGKECVCIPGCWKHPSKNECVPGASQLPHVPGTGNHGGNHGGHHGNGHGWWKRDEAPVWSSKLHQRDQDSLFCPDGLSACPIPATLGGYECVDVRTELEQCGGCLADGAGQDCTQIAGVSGVGCQSGKCVVFSCDESHQLTASGECTPSLTKRSA